MCSDGLPMYQELTMPLDSTAQDISLDTDSAAMPGRDDGHGTPLDADAPMKPVNGHGQPLRVVHIISGLGQGGAETVLYRLVTARQHNTEHIVVSMGDEGVLGPRLHQDGVAVHTLNMTSTLGMAAGPVTVRRRMRDVRPDG